MTKEKRLELKKAILKLSAGSLEKLAVAGMILVVFQGATKCLWLACSFFALSYLLTYLEVR